MRIGLLSICFTGNSQALWVYRLAKLDGGCGALFALCTTMFLILFLKHNFLLFNKNIYALLSVSMEEVFYH